MNREVRRHSGVYWACGLTGLFLGGPVSGALSLACFYLILKNATRAGVGGSNAARSPIFLSLLGWGAIGSIAMPISWFAANGIGWNFDAVALIQSTGKYKSYRDWSEAEKVEAEAKRAHARAEKARKKQRQEDTIAAHPGFNSVKDLVDNGICMKVKYFGHLGPDAGYNPIIYGGNNPQVFMQPLDRPGEMESKWHRNPEYREACFTLDSDWRGSDREPISYLRYASGAVSSDDNLKLIRLIRDKERGTAEYIDCDQKVFRDSSNTNRESTIWTTYTMEPFISVGEMELDRICANQGIRELLSGSILGLEG